MNSRISLGAGALLAALLSTTAAQADVTAAQVWQDWKDYYTSFGQTITTASEAMEGDTLVARDVKITSDRPEAKTEGTIAEVRLQEMGDGTVQITMSKEIPLKMHAEPPEGTPSDATMTVTQTDMKINVSGTPEAMDYDVDAPEMQLALDEVKVDGTSPPFKMLMTAKGSTAKYHSEKSGGRTVKSDFKADSLDFTMTGADPEGSGTFTMTGQMNGMTGTGNVVLPEGADMKNLGLALNAGTVIDGVFNYADGNFKAEGTGGQGAFTADSSGGAGKLNFKMSKDGLAYGGDAGASKLSITSAAVPFPIEAELAQSAFNLVMPVSKSDSPGPAAFLVKLVDLKVSDALWNMVDPSSQLPRDPATLIIDLSGAIKPLVDLFDPEATKALAEASASATAAPAPFEVSEAKINQLQVKAVGAELTGTGAMTFDNSSGTPMPLGNIDLNLTGANALMDKLVAMGLLPADQVMGVKMMMGMFAVPAGDDALTSKIEFKEGGSIFANGQQIK